MSKFTHFARLATVRVPTHARTGGSSGQCAGWEPATDIYERARDVVVVVELPGCDGDRIQVTVERHVLHIKGIRARRVPEGARGVQQLEIPHGAFERTIPLGPGFDHEGIEAVYADGFLTVTLPRRRR